MSEVGRIGRRSIALLNRFNQLTGCCFYPKTFITNYSAVMADNNSILSGGLPKRKQVKLIKKHLTRHELQNYYIIQR